MTIAIASKGKIASFGKKPIWITVGSGPRAWISGIVYIPIFGLFLLLIFTTNVLRDAGPKPLSGKKPCSLGAIQMAFWFVLVSGGFLYVWFPFGDLDVLTPSVLILIGISATTSLVWYSLASSKQTAIPSELLTLEQEKTDLEKRLEDLVALSGATPSPPNLEALEKEESQKNARLNVIDAKIGELTAPPKSAGLFKDILSLDGNVSLPRFQMLAWTLILGGVFVNDVLTTRTMPEFDATLLSLMGISSRTYVGFKIPSKTGK